MSQLRKIQRRNQPKKKRVKPVPTPDLSALMDGLERNMGKFFPDLRDPSRQDLIVVDSLRTETRMAYDLMDHQRQALGMMPRVLVVSNPDDEMRLLEERIKEILQRTGGL